MNGGRGSQSEVDRGFPGQAGGLIDVARRFCLLSLNPEHAMADSFYHPGGSQGSVGQLSHSLTNPGDLRGAGGASVQCRDLFSETFRSHDPRGPVRVSHIATPAR